MECNSAFAGKHHGKGMIRAGNNSAGDRISITAPIPGNCPVCGAKHREDRPHRLNSVWYQTHFYYEYGRYPSADDAMSHCTERVKAKETQKSARMKADEAGTYE